MGQGYTSKLGNANSETPFEEILWRKRSICKALRFPLDHWLNKYTPKGQLWLLDGLTKKLSALPRKCTLHVAFGVKPKLSWFSTGAKGRSLVIKHSPFFLEPHLKAKISTSQMGLHLRMDSFVLIVYERAVASPYWSFSKLSIIPFPNKCWQWCSAVPSGYLRYHCLLHSYGFIFWLSNSPTP